MAASERDITPRGLAIKKIRGSLKDRKVCLRQAFPDAARHPFVFANPK